MAQIQNYDGFAPEEFLRDYRARIQRSVLTPFCGILLLFVGRLSAQTNDSIVEVPKPPFVTGTLNFTCDTHLMYYGQDEWAAGSSWKNPLFHPSLELNFDLGKGFKAVLGTWWDVNDNAKSSITRGIQEVDVWSGISYGVKEWSFTLLYQEMMYSSQNERIVDFKANYSSWLNPNLNLHGRVDGAKPFGSGLAAVLGIAPSKQIGITTFSLPVNVGFDTHNFHGGDAGFSFISAGVGVSVPLKFLKGNWSFNAGVNYYHTNPKVIPVNPKSNFPTANIGITFLF